MDVEIAGRIDLRMLPRLEHDAAACLFDDGRTLDTLALGKPEPLKNGQSLPLAINHD